MLHQRAQKGAAAAAAIVPVQLNPLQIYQKRQDIRIPRPGDTQTLSLFLPELCKSMLHHTIDVRRQAVFRDALVVNTVLEGAIGTDERLQGLPHVQIHRSASSHCRRDKRTYQEEQQIFVVLQVLPRKPDVRIGKYLRVEWLHSVVLARFQQKFAIEGTIYRDLAFRSAAHRADIPPYARAEAPGTASLANRATHSFSIGDVPRGSRQAAMQSRA